MIVIKMELWPHGDDAKAELLACATIINDGTGTPTRGNYDLELFNGKRRWKTGRVEGFPRKKLLGWDLLYRGLNSLIGDRNNQEKDARNSDQET